MDAQAYDRSLIGDWLGHDLDAWTRRVVRRNFHPDTGAPYWLKRVADLGFDPLEIETFADLVNFGPFPLEILRTIDPAALVPQAVPRPLSGRVWETGGTTGKPCRVFLTDDTIAERGEWKRWALVKDGFDEGRNWLQASPTGPHIVGNSISEITDQYPYAGQVHTIDMDPRWVKRMIRAGNLPVANEYTDHLLEQIIQILDTQEIHYLCTTPALFHLMLTKHRAHAARLQGVALVGTRVTPEMYADFVDVLGSGVCALWYGNTLYGIAPMLPPRTGARCCRTCRRTRRCSSRWSRSTTGRPPWSTARWARSR
ncbi:hypothetical protein [Thermocatellispora tengchongensis]|uniref:hypothetical protein n=1 Tax=Thermocatellispora tengchongensis TaxID=1073253 RepID=UPI00362FD876